MARNGSGTYSLASGNPVVTGTTISSSWANTTLSDIATALTQSLAYDGQTTPIANIPLGGYKLTGVGAATARTDAATLASIQDGTGTYVATVGGTADVITLTPSPAITAYAAGQKFSFIASGANTTNVTVNISALGAKAVTKNGTTALVAGDIPSGAMVEIEYDGTRFQLGTLGAATVPAGALLLAGGTMTGDITFTGNAGLNEARADIAMHATTMDLWAGPNVLNGTGSAVTMTDIADAPQAGARRTLIPITGTVITDGAVFDVDGDANYTTAAGDRVEFEAVTVSTFKVHITKADGTAVAVAATGIGNGCSVYHSTTQSINTATWTTLTWDSENYDDSTYHDTVTNPSRITVNFTGRIRLEALAADAANSSVERAVRFLADGSATNMPVFTNNVYSGTTTNNKTTYGVHELDVTSGQYFEVQFFQQTGGAQNVVGGNGVSWFRMTRIK